MSSAADLLEATAQTDDEAPGSKGADHNADRETRRQAAVVAFGRRAVDPTDIERMVQDAAALVAETLNAPRCGVAELTDNGQKLRLRIGTVGSQQASLQADLGSSEHQAPLDQSTSLAAYAMHTAQPVVVCDLTSEERTQDRFLRDHGVRGALVIPLHGDEDSYEVRSRAPPMAVARIRPGRHPVRRGDRPPREHDDWPRPHAENTEGRAGIHPHGAGDGRRAGRRVSSRRPDSADQSVLPAMRDRCTSDELHDAVIWKTLLVSEEVPAIRAVLDKISGANQPLEHECHIVTKQGERRLIRWSFAVLSQTGGGIESIIGTGIDITEQQVSKTEVNRLQAAAIESNRQLESLTSQLKEQGVAVPAIQSANAHSPAPFPSAVLLLRIADQRRHPRRSF